MKVLYTAQEAVELLGLSSVKFCQIADILVNWLTHYWKSLLLRSSKNGTRQWQHGTAAVLDWWRENDSLTQVKQLILDKISDHDIRSVNRFSFSPMAVPSFSAVSVISDAVNFSAFLYVISVIPGDITDRRSVTWTWNQCYTFLKVFIGVNFLINTIVKIW